MTDIIVDNENPVYDSRNNCNAIIETASNKLLIGCKTSVIPESVTSIGAGAFVECTGLTSIVIPNSVVEIGYAAFSQCGNLSSVILPENIASIGEGVFWRCSRLKSIGIPKNVNYIGKEAFYGCYFSQVTSLNPVPPEVGEDGLYPQNNSTLYVPVGSKASYENAEVWKNFTNIVEGNQSGIDVLTNEKEKDFPIYDLNGVRQNVIRKGINVIGGKKVVIK